MTSKLIPDPVVARDRYGVNPRTIVRWDANPELGFPPPIYINRRKYREEAKLNAFDRAQAAKSAQISARKRIAAAE